jgi:hypothetical protein
VQAFEVEGAQKESELDRSSTLTKFERFYKEPPANHRAESVGDDSERMWGRMVAVMGEVPDLGSCADGVFDAWWDVFDGLAG